MWNPTTYLRYGDQRSRPFFDLVAQVSVERPRQVVDLGCGPGTLTRALARRWPDATVTGVDSAPEMIDAALATGVAADQGVAAGALAGGAAPTGAPVDGTPTGGDVRFILGDVRDWTPGPRDDVVVCNAVLQWVPGHAELLRDWARRMPAGSWLAVQVPGNFDAPCHRLLRVVADEVRWRDRLGPLMRSTPVADPVDYVTLLVGVGCQVDAWETTYLHLLPAVDGPDHPVLNWMEGTALRPVRAALDDADWAAFRTSFGDRLARTYPVRAGQVYFPFRRVFFVARIGAKEAA